MDFISCIHCTFWLKYQYYYDDIGITEDDSKKLQKYYDTCLETHNYSSCNRNSSTGGCLLCNANIGCYPQCIIREENIKKERKKQIEENNDFSFVSVKNYLPKKNEKIIIKI